MQSKIQNPKSKIEQVWLESGEKAIATFVVSVKEVEEVLVFAVLMKQQEVKKGDRVLEEVRSLSNTKKQPHKLTNLSK